MDTENLKIEKYPIPFKAHSQNKLSYHFGLVFISAMFIGFLFIPMGNDLQSLVVKGLSLVFAIFLAYVWLFTGIFKRYFVELTEDYLYVNTPFGLKRAKLKDIYDVEVYTLNRNTMIGIVLTDKIKNQKKSFGNFLNNMYGGRFSLNIAMSNFVNLDIDKLYATIREAIIEANKNSQDELADNSESYKDEPADSEGPGNCFIALIKVFILTILIGLGYGVSIFILKVNFIIIPIFGTLAMIYFYHRSYKEEKINFIMRFIVGLLCCLQVFIGAITAVFLTTKLPIRIDYITYTTKDYLSYLLQEPMKQFPIILMAIICFIYGAFQGHKFKVQKAVEKMFYKKIGTYSYKKQGKLITIFLKDPLLIKENEKKYGIQINEGCFIAREKNTIKALYLPSDFIDEVGHTIKYDCRGEIDSKEYYEIGYKENAKYQPYVFPCVLISDKNKQVEKIRIQL